LAIYPNWWHKVRRQTNKTFLTAKKTTEYNVVFGGYAWAGENNPQFSVAHP
jgi:hypothetical protein